MSMRGLLGWTIAAVLMGGFLPAFATEPVGDETFEGGFSCLKPSTKTDTAPIVCQSEINPSLPSFDFSLIWHSDKATGTRVLDRIEIRRKGEPQPFQVLDKVESNLPPDIANSGFELLDLNFDGYLDLRVMRLVPAGPNTPYQNWLWSKDEGKFVENPGLDEITSPQFDAESQEIVSHWRSSAAEHGADVYSYDGATPVLIHRETDKMAEGGACLRTFYDRIEDELRKTGSGPCKDDE
ncbi:MAG TPA: hypothetical protein VGN05_06505 [Parvibaculum sp.]